MIKIMDRKKIIIIIVLCIVVFILIFSSFIKERSNIDTIFVVDDEYYNEWDEYYDINNDYIGHLTFDSGIIDLPVVQANDNDYYLRRNINKEYDIKGTPFMDYRCSLDDQNIIIYGHYIKKGSKEMFTPLEKLVDSRNSDYVSLKLRTFIKRYQLVSIMVVNGEDGSLYPFLTQNFEQEDIDELNEFIMDNSSYYSNTLITTDDSILTLVTCTDRLKEYREVAVFKNITQIRD